MNPISLIFPQTVYKTRSKFSGEIKVIDHAFSRRVVVGGLTQSGGILYSMWHGVCKVLRSKYHVLRLKNVLVLGLGAGTVVEVINKRYPDAKITAVEIDPEMVEVGKKYFKLDQAENLEIIIGDANKVIHHSSFIIHHSYDLIIVDLYKGFLIEKNSKNINFLRKISQKLSKNGIVIFNVLAPQNDNSEASIFLDNLHEIFEDIFCNRIIVNNIFFCKF